MRQYQVNTWFVDTEVCHELKDGTLLWREGDVHELSTAIEAESPLEAVEEALAFLDIPYFELIRHRDQRWAFRVIVDRDRTTYRHVHVSVGQGIDAFGKDVGEAPF